MNSKNLDNSMLRQVRFAPEFGRKMMQAITAEKLEQALPEEIAASIDRVIITGCGDSYLAGVAAKPAFDALTNVRCEPVRNVAFTRHYSQELLTKNTLVIGVSVSGTASRVIEAMERGNAHGCHTLMISDNGEALSMKEAEHCIVMGMPELEPCAGNCSYIATTYTLCCIAQRIGQVRGMADPDFEENFASYFDSFAGVMESLEERCLQVADKIAGCTKLDFVGDGVHEAQAYFGQAKFVEMCGMGGTVSDSEDWCHINYFISHPKDIASFVSVDKDSPALSRNKEVIGTMVNLGRKCVVLTDCDPAEFPEGAMVISMPSSNCPYVKALMMHLPYDAISAFVCMERGLNPFAHWEGSPWQLPECSSHTKDSEIVIL